VPACGVDFSAQGSRAFRIVEKTLSLISQSCDFAINETSETTDETLSVRGQKFYGITLAD